MCVILLHLCYTVHLSYTCTFCAQLKKMHATAHWEGMRGTLKQASDYCQKSKTKICGPFIYGDMPAGQGERTDLQRVYNMVKEKKTDLEMMEATEGACAKFEKQIKYMRFVQMEKESDRQIQGVRVITLYGPTGAGKTHAAINFIANNCDYYVCQAPSHKQSKMWFDGYEGQHILLLEDFEGNFCPFRFLLTLLDKYKMKVEIKGGHVWACWTTIVITTNTHPANWYHDIDVSPLRRRLTTGGSEIRYMEPASQGHYKQMDWEERVISPDFLPFQLGIPETQPPPSVPLAASQPASPQQDVPPPAAASTADAQADANHYFLDSQPLPPTQPWDLHIHLSDDEDIV